MSNVSVYFSLGSNLGDREANIAETLRRMDEAFGTGYSSLSKLIETEPMGFSGGKFLNAAVLYKIAMDPVVPDCAPGEQAFRILDKVKEIERAMGRTEPPEYDAAGKRIYHSRIIDIDILFFGSEIIDTKRLTVPHKGIRLRPFVMTPLLEIAQPALKASFPEYFAGS